MISRAQVNACGVLLVSGGGSGWRLVLPRPSRAKSLDVPVRQNPISASKARLSLVPTVLLRPERRALNFCGKTHSVAAAWKADTHQNPHCMNLRGGRSILDRSEGG